MIERASPGSSQLTFGEYDLDPSPEPPASPAPRPRGPEAHSTPLSTPLAPAHSPAFNHAHASPLVSAPPTSLLVFKLVPFF